MNLDRAILGDNDWKPVVPNTTLDKIREAYEFYKLDSEPSMAAQIFVQQVGEILDDATD